jgi:hypothetical protein
LKVKSGKEKVKTYSEIYEEKYLDKTSQKKTLYFDAIFKYITGSQSFNIEELLTEVKGNYQIEDSKIPEREKIMQKLSYWQCTDLPLKEYRKLTSQMLSFVDMGEYKLEQYSTIFHYSTRFNNILNLSLNKLVKRFKRGIKKGDFEYHPSLHFHLSISPNSEFFDELKEVGEHCLEVNKQIKRNSENAEIESLFELFKTNIVEFLEKVNEPNTQLRYSPVFSKFNFNKFWTTFKKAKNTELIEFGFELKRRYIKNVYPELNSEKQFLEKLKEKLELEIGKQKTRKLDKVAFEFLVKNINESLENF